MKFTKRMLDLCITVCVSFASRKFEAPSGSTDCKACLQILLIVALGNRKLSIDRFSLRRTVSKFDSCSSFLHPFAGIVDWLFCCVLLCSPSCLSLPSDSLYQVICCPVWHYLPKTINASAFSPISFSTTHFLS